MNSAAERSIPLWVKTAEVEDAPSLEGHQQADVLVVGSGIAGLSCAYELGRAGKSVVVLDRGPLVGGMSSRTTAHLACEWDDFFHELIRLRGEGEARLCFESQSAAIDRIEEIQSTEPIDCDFKRIDGYLFPASASDEDLLIREIQACHRIGISDVGWVDRAPLPGASGGRALRFPRQGRFHPRKYLGGLVAAIRRQGGRLYANAAVTGVTEQAGEVTAATEKGWKVHAGAAVIATNSPVNDWVAIQTKQAPYRTYVIAGRVPAGSVPDALFWDTLDPYHYVRLQPLADGSDMLIVGGEDHKTGQAEDMERRLADLEAWTRRHFPGFTRAEERWSGQVLEPVDTLPFIGRNPGNSEVYVATGDSGQGMTSGALAGMLIRDLILKHDNPWAAVYDPGRKTLRALRDFVSENVTMVKGLAEHLVPGEVASLDEVPPGEGAIVRKGAKKLAAYRAESGRLYVHSATCTHAGCILHWNPFERCWDCPCHGSHFAPDGGVLNAPAVHGLKEAD